MNKYIPSLFLNDFSPIYLSSLHTLLHAMYSFHIWFEIERVSLRQKDDSEKMFISKLIYKPTLYNTTLQFTCKASKISEK